MRKKTAYAQVSSLPSLRAAFSYIYSNSSGKSKYTSGVDGQTLIDFHVRQDELLAKLASDLNNKKFRFSKLSPHFIKKDSGKERVICVPTVRDRVVQRSLLDYLCHKYEKKVDNSISYGFINEKGVEKAAKRCCTLRKNKPWVFKTDITAFFDRVPRAKLKDRLSKLIREPSLLPLLENAIDSEIFIDSPSTELRIQAQGIIKGIGIRQGMPLSPFLSNVMLNRFDKAIETAQISAVRYADDLIFFGNSESECKTIHSFCEKGLLEEGFTIPSLEAKTKSMIYSEGETAEFLGLSLVRQTNNTYLLVVSPEQTIRIRTELFKLTDIGNLNKLNIDFFKFGQALNSRIGGYVNAYSMCTNVKEFENKLEAMRKKIYEAVLINLGIQRTKLTPTTKRFFKID